MYCQPFFIIVLICTLRTPASGTKKTHYVKRNTERQRVSNAKTAFVQYCSLFKQSFAALTLMGLILLKFLRSPSY